MTLPSAYAGSKGAKANHRATSGTERLLTQEQFDQGLIVLQCAKIGAYGALGSLAGGCQTCVGMGKSREFQPIDESCVLLLS